jgi:uncharacterized protein YbaP (TraB family)
MKRLTTVTIVASSIALFFAATPQEKPQKGMDHQKHIQVMQTLKDSSMMDMMIANIAADNAMRTKMMQKTMEYIKGDTTSTMELCKVMMQDNDMQSMKGCGMMKHEMMDKKNDKNKASHEQHH